MKQILNTLTLTALIGLASFTNSAVADVQAPHPLTDEKSVVLHVGDLDPAVPAEASQLLGMVKVAVRRACMRNDETRAIFHGRDRATCTAESYAKAVATINARARVDLEAVAARHQEQVDIAAAAR